MSTHKKKEGITFSVEDSITMERTESVMPGKADSMLKVIQNGLAKLEIGNKWDGIQYDQIEAKWSTSAAVIRYPSTGQGISRVN